jgi:phage gp46-like protein
MDIEIFWDPVLSRGDFAVVNGDLAAEHDIKTAVLVSLFTDRRAEDDDPLPDATASKRGWWGDALGAVGPGARIGSRLWLLSREKQLAEVVARASEYAIESLTWLVDSGAASAVDAKAEIVANGVLGLLISVSRPKSQALQYRFNFAWMNANQVRN